MEDPDMQKWTKRMEDLSNGIASHELEAITLQGIQVVRANKGYFLCKFVVPSRLSDSNGNWHIGAMATLVDVVCATAINSVSSSGKSVSVDYSLSFYSPAKIDEEVEIEAKVVGRKDRLTSAVVEVRRKQMEIWWLLVNNGCSQLPPDTYRVSCSIVFQPKNSSNCSVPCIGQ